MAQSKELNFFCSSDELGRAPSTGMNRSSGPAPVRGESSPLYTNLPERTRDIPQRMASVVPEARLIYLVRDPIDRLISSISLRPLGRGLATTARSRTCSPISMTSHNRGESRYAYQLEQYLATLSPDADPHLRQLRPARPVPRRRWRASSASSSRRHVHERCVRPAPLRDRGISTRRMLSAGRAKSLGYRTLGSNRARQTQVQDSRFRSSGPCSLGPRFPQSPRARASEPSSRLPQGGCRAPPRAHGPAIRELVRV